MEENPEMAGLISEIKRKKELSGIPDDLVKEILQKHLSKAKIKSKKDVKLIIKAARHDLRNYVGRFTLNKDYSQSIDSPEEILEAHKSTKERIDFYPQLKDIIFSSNPKSILDIGCGLNPLALASKEIEYYASDIDDSALKLVSLYFKKNNFPGHVLNQDIRKARDFPETDVCLILKLFDIIKLPHREVRDILSSIRSKKIIISFPTITLSGKPMKNKKRYWFEKILDSLALNYSTISSKNELFYIVERD